MKKNLIQEVKRVNTLGLPLSTISFQESIEHICHVAQYDPQGFACFANAHMTIESYWDSSFSKQLHQARFIFSDGMPLVWATRLLNRQIQERIAGMDALPAILQQAEKERLAVYFYGSTPKVLQTIQKRLMQEYPNLQIAGMISPPFKAQSNEQILQDIEEIKTSGAKLVFVALGCPKQEKWMAKYSPHIPAILLGVGGAFSVFARSQKRAPIWMRKIGLEWLFRFIQEPKRLWRRYVITNPLFIWLLLKAWLSKK